FDEQSDRVDDTDHPPGDHFIQPMQFVGLQFEALAPDWLRLPPQVEQSNIDLDESALLTDRAIDRVVQLLALEKIFAGVIDRSLVDKRNGGNDVEPAKPCQPRGDVVTQRKGQVLNSFSVPCFCFFLKGEYRNSQPISAYQPLMNIGFRAQWRAVGHKLPVVRRCAPDLMSCQSPRVP